MPENRPPSETFAEQLKTHRAAAALTATELAEKAGLRPTAVRAYERAACRPPAGAARNLAQALDLNRDATTAFLAAAGHDPQPESSPSQPVNVNVHMNI